MLPIALNRLTRSEGATLFMTLLAGFQALLYRYSGQEDIPVGTPIANRRRPELEGLIGFFVNTLVLRGDLSGDPSFREHLRRVRDSALRAFEHQDVPFEKVVDVLEPERTLSHSPLFQVMFVMQNIRGASGKLPGLEVSQVEMDGGTSKFDLTLAMQEDEDGLSGSFEYNTDLFDESTIERMAVHFEELLRGAVADPESRISELPLLREEERDLLLNEWSGEEVPYPAGQAIHELFEACVDEAPDRVAVVGPTLGTCGEPGERVELSYGELESRANRLAAYLRGLGVGPETRVGLCVERSVEMVVGVLAVWKAGGAYVPLDPSYPAERLRFMAEDAGLGALVTQESLQGVVRVPESAHGVCVDAQWLEIEAHAADRVESGVGPDGLAYVIYTSGSTGVPKGVQIEHGSVMNLGESLRTKVYRFGPERPLRVGLNAPLVFDASVQQLVALLYGHALHVIPAETRRDPESLVRCVRENRLDVLDCVPSQLRILLAAGLLEESEWVPSLVLPGGEAIDPQLWGELAVAPRTEFFNMYGPTECTVDSTIGRVSEEGSVPTLGRPVPNARAYVLDERMNPVPVGVPGELYVGGAGVARGYLNRPELTEERFQMASFDGGGRLYRTGDRVRWRASGSLDYLGRLDDQVKVRGFRIEPGEIEAILGEHADVWKAAVIARADNTGASRLVAYVVPADGDKDESSARIESWRSHLRDRVPEYMVPTVWVEMDEFPHTTSGKVNRRALPEPAIDRSNLAT